MDSDNLRVLKSLQAALDILPENERKYILGYAEGATDMAKHFQAEKEIA